MTSAVTVVDYGLGNIYSVRRALEHCGASVTVTSDAAAVMQAQRLVLPGVGAFADGMHGLSEYGLISPIRAFAASGRPLLGICLGMQMLASVSTEFGVHDGLDLIPGEVVPIPGIDVDGQPHRIPHIGWSGLEKPPAIAAWDDTVLSGVAEGEPVYHVHSYTVVPRDESHRLADWFYGGQRIAAAIRSGNIYGCQFHPEKSGPAGLRILRNFIT